MPVSIETSSYKLVIFSFIIKIFKNKTLTKMMQISFSKDFFDTV